MVHTKSSKLSLPGGDSASSKEKLETTVTQNGSYTDPLGRRKSKRFKVAAESESPPDSGSISLQLRSRTIQKEFQIQTCENRNVSDDCVPSFEAEVELIPGENVGERDGLKSVDEKLCNDIVTEETESQEVNMQEPMKDRNLPENTSELNMAKLQSRSITFTEEDASKDVVLGSVCRQSIIGTKQLRTRTISVERDLSPNMGSKFSTSGMTVKVAVSMEEKNLVLEKSDSGDHFGHFLAKNTSPEVLEPLELDKSMVTVPNPIEAAGSVDTKKGLAMPSSLKPSNEMNGDYGEESRRMVIMNKERFALNHRLSNGGIPSGSRSGDSALSKVKEILRFFHGTCRKILQEEEAMPMKRNGGKFRVVCEALKILKSQGKHLNYGTQIMGTVPGIEVGDEFQFRIELNFLGIHRPPQGGIDFMKDDGGELVATSIVSSGVYDDDLDNSDVLIYSGQGGNMGKGKNKENNVNEAKDQQLVKGNLA
ncbi:Histone-lysine N-methyltransferase, H3 lysine-9 specific SUVH5 [Cardamine amara subsp. amara]|uniref:Histone-lysine N-methyltransferase, H3 lysine-9 specific SUVH5 n=1 Tax=Cardamine amara subsp. amara TaxID=228776 RepID=A0ABD1A0R7_CARAN